MELEGRAIHAPSLTSVRNPSPIELGVNYPNTSSVFTENGSIPSNVNELGISTPNHTPTNLPSTPIDSSRISFYSGQDSSNTSLISEDGSRIRVAERER